MRIFQFQRYFSVYFIIVLASYIYINPVEAAYHLRWSFQANATVNSLAFSPREDLVAVGTDEIPQKKESEAERGRIYVWSLRTGKLFRYFKMVGDVNGVAFTPDGRFLLGTGGIYETRGEFKAWDLKSNQLWTSFTNPQREIFTCLTISPDGKLAACGTFGRIYLLRLSNGRITRHFMGREGEKFSSVEFSPDGKRLLGISDNRSLRIWSLISGELYCPETDSGSPFSGMNAKFLIDGRICVGNGSTLRLVDQNLTTVYHTIKSPSIPVCALAVEKFGLLAATGSGSCLYLRTNGTQDGADPVLIWDLKTLRLAARLDGHSRRVTAVAFSSCQFLASGSADHTAKIWKDVIND